MHGHHRFLYFLRNRELNELYASIAIRSFTMSMIAIFIPIYLLETGYSIAWVFLFYAIFSAFHALFSVPAAKISSRFGFKHCMLFSMPLLILFHIMLYTLETHGWPLYLLAAVLGVSSALFWLAYHTDFAKFSKKKNRGKEIGVAKMFISVFHVAGPVIGGIILATLGFQALFLIVSSLLFFSIIPLFFSDDVHEPINFSIRQIFTDQKLKSYMAFIGYGVESGVAKIIWPVFIFFSILNSFTALGLVETISLFSSLLVTIIVAKYSDIKRRLVLRLGAMLNAIVWVIKATVTTALQVYVFDSLYGMTKMIKEIPFDAMGYDEANRTNIIEYIAFREIVLHLGRIMLLISMILISSLVAGLLFGAGASLLYLAF